MPKYLSAHKNDPMTMNNTFQCNYNKGSYLLVTFFQRLPTKSKNILDSFQVNRSLMCNNFGHENQLTRLFNCLNFCTLRANLLSEACFQARASQPRPKVNAHRKQLLIELFGKSQRHDWVLEVNLVHHQFGTLNEQVHKALNAVSHRLGCHAQLLCKKNVQMSREVIINGQRHVTNVERTGGASVHPRIRPFPDEFQGDAAELLHDCQWKVTWLL